jgi:CubicO group peptidase (beta-lactamase class C family)
VPDAVDRDTPHPVKTHLLLLGLTAALVTCLTVPAASPGPLPRATPESQGVSSTGLLGLVEALDHVDQVHSVMVLRHGRVIAEGWWTPYTSADRHELFSLSKSFTSTAIGFAVSEGRLTLDDPVTRFFPGDVPQSPGPNLAGMRVRDLITMSTGHLDEPSSDASQVSPASFLAQPVPFKPGTHFKYNTAATFMLSAIVQKVAGQTTLDYLRPRLFDPLGIKSPTWATNFQGISLGGYGLSVRTEDIARFGQLYLQQGLWQGRRLLPASWIDQATARQTSTGSNPASDWDQGYGFQFWRCRHGAYRGDGAFGQYCVVLPEQDMVVAITSGVGDMQAVLNMLWDHLLPAIHASRLGADRKALDALTARLHSLSVPRVQGDVTSAMMAKVAGRKYLFGTNDQKLEWVTLRPHDASGEGAVVTVRLEGHDFSLECRPGQWTRGRAFFRHLGETPAAASGAWADPGTFICKYCLLESTSSVTLRLEFSGDEVTCRLTPAASFVPVKLAPLTGRAP